MCNFEYCIECDNMTGNAGRGDGSIYIEREGKEIGPLCDSCYDEMNDKLIVNKKGLAEGLQVL